MATGTVSPDFTVQRKPLDVNKYATKKTIAQGMLDIALLTANASQLKYILQVGQKHEFYTLMLSLITASIILQVVIGVLLLSLNLMRDCRLHMEEYKTSATYINYITTSLSVAISAINLLISAFDPSLAQFASSVDQVLVGVLFLVIGGMDIKREKDQRTATILNDVILVIIFVISLVNVIISSFGIEYTNNHLVLMRKEVAVAVLSFILSRMEALQSKEEIMTAVLNHFALGLSLLAMVFDLIKMSFGLDPALSLSDYERYRNITK